MCGVGKVLGCSGWGHSGLIVDAPNRFLVDVMVLHL
jgi:hypothetical protein